MHQSLYSKAKQLDDQHWPYRQEFYLPADGQVYLDGNSLGLLSKPAEEAVYRVINDWKTHAIDGWTEGRQPWFYLASTLSRYASGLIGAQQKETVITGSITANLHQLLATFYQPEGTRREVVTEAVAFPTDSYVTNSWVKHGADKIEVSPREDRLLYEEDIEARLSERTALVLLPSVLYRTGQRLDMKRLTEAAHSAGAVIGWDLAHSFGVMPHELHEEGADFAVWCTYKYANGGPGATGGLYVHEKHHHTSPALTGWFGSDQTKQFDMDTVFEPASDASAFQMGTPNILSMAPLIGSLEMLVEAGIDTIRSRSLQLTALLREGINSLQELDNRLQVVTPAACGGHIACSHPEAARIVKALKASGVVPDFRAPDIIRLAPSPLYTSAADVIQAVETLEAILKNRTYEQYENKRGIIA
ncbi:kynureninase [Alkalicoccus luteus]|uniref:Kynureninase n=1 Tax=Alkalicoccus luteus TaxID=1237094 RepID=A0A969Q072_9BACI|nr:kynureninase [Alkalicoccus luteus]NJP38747.1 kynureninase [Alkalicoccus luteus]